MWLSLVSVIFLDAAPPTGSISPLAWAIIVALSTVCVTVIPALWYRGNKMHDRAEEIREKMYADLKDCNEKKVELEDELLDLLKLLVLQMEQSKGGKKK